MKILLEDLWNKYEFERTDCLSPEEKKRLINLNEAREKISLTPESEKAFEAYLDILSEISFEKSKSSFFNGLKFGVKFIMETAID